jgi:hypothetical protein
MMRTITVDVEIDLGDFDDDDLIDELESRGQSVAGTLGDGAASLQEIYYALKFGLNERALELMRRHISDQLGVVL